MKIKKTVKGFTLIELIIVSAIFGMLMIGAMALMKPVSLFYRQNVEYEAARSSMDMIGDYLEGKLRYCEQIYLINKREAFDDSWIEDAARNKFTILDDTDLFKEDMYSIGVDNSNGGRIVLRKWAEGTSLSDPPEVSPSVISAGIYENYEYEISIFDYVFDPDFVMEAFSVEITALKLDAFGNLDTNGISKMMDVRLLNIVDTYDANANPLQHNTIRSHMMALPNPVESENFHIFYTLPSGITF